MASITFHHYISFNLNHNIFLFLLNNFVIFIQNIYFSSLAKSFFLNFVIKIFLFFLFFLNKFVIFIYFSSQEYQTMKNKCLQGLPPTPTYLITLEFHPNRLVPRYNKLTFARPSQSVSAIQLPTNIFLLGAFFKNFALFLFF